MKIIGRSGSAYLLVDESLPREPLRGDVPGRVLDTDRGILFEPAPAGSIIKFDPYYEEYDGDQSDIDRLMRDVDNVRGPPVDEVGTLERFGRSRRRSERS